MNHLDGGTRASHTVEVAMRLFRRKTTTPPAGTREPTWRERRAAARTARAERDLRRTEQKIRDLAARHRSRP